MANRYWVGGSAAWDATAGSKWATTSGGAGGAAVPTSADDVFFDAASGAVTITIQTADPATKSLNFTGFTGTLAGSTRTLSVAGSLTLATGMTWSYTGNFQWNGTGSSTITFAGKTISCVQFLINGSGGTLTLQDTMSISGSTGLVMQNGTFDANDQNLSMIQMDGSGAATAALVMGNGTWTLTGTSTVWSAGNLTITCENSTIKLTDTSSSTCIFAGNGKTYNVLWLARGASTGINTISGSNTFTTLKDTGTVAHTTRFTAGTTQTISSAAGWQISGSAGQLITITSTTTGTHTISVASGNVSADYLSLQHSVASGGANFYAGANSTNNQGVSTAGSGWVFTAPPNNYTQTCSETLTSADTLTKTPSRSLSEAFSIIEALVRTTTRSLLESISNSDTLAALRLVSATFTQTVTHLDTFLRTLTRSLVESATNSDTVARTVTRLYTETVSTTDSLAHGAAKMFSDALSSVDSMVRTTGRSLLETITDTDSVQRTTARLYTNTLSVADFILKAAAKVFADGASLVDSLVRTSAHILPETVTDADSLNRTTATARTENLSIADTVLRLIGKVLTEGVSLIEFFIRRLNGLRTFYESKFTSRGSSHDSKFTTRGTSHTSKFE